MSELTEVQQSLSTEDIVHLYKLDASSIGGSVYYFTSSAFPDTEIVWDGETYTPIEMESDGWEWSGRGTLPQPKLRISNSNLVLSSLVNSTQDMLGCVVTRTRTFKQFLDGKPDADPTAHFPLDVYKIERKSAQTKEAIEFELSAAIDQEGRKLPGRQIIQGTCRHKYRVWTGEDFGYAAATCPYAGDDYFTANGEVTTAANDKCGKKLSDCVLRFGTAPLPTRSFPGVSRYR